jgi:hypothetical protein
MAQLDRPAYLLSATFGVKDLFLRGVISNQGSNTVVSYRLGWVYIYPDRTELKLGEWMNVPAGIAPGELHEVPAQGVSPEPVRLGAKRVEFFVAEVKYSGGGSWKEDLSQFRQMKLPLEPLVGRQKSGL